MSWFGKKSIGDNTLREIGDIERLVRTKGAPQAGVEIKAAARSGNLMCQVFLSQAAFSVPEHLQNELIKSDMEEFTRLAAQSGDPESQFNLAKLYFGKISPDSDTISTEELSYISEAKAWHRKAAAQGFEPSVQALKRLDCFPD